MENEILKEKVQNIIQLPALPAIAVEVASLIDNPNTSVSRITQVISADQVLTAKVLKIANSPFYGFQKKISTLDFAIMVLGFDSLKEILISVSLISAFKKKQDKYFDSREFWEHSLASAIAARTLARQLGYRISGESFVAGLLHDIGILVTHQYFYEDYKRIVEAVTDGKATFQDTEQEVLFATHGEIGAWLAERWNLPDQLIETIKFHHKPELAERNPQLTALIHFVDYLCHKLQIGMFSYERVETYNPQALKTLNLSESEVTQSFLDTFGSRLRQDLEKTFVGII
ncbi:MAG TPA: HDOD domain-containing protein [Candidatus Acidoferrales bacterium]|nr:HDOD domain-containing protein [Candidatus Acidoferrales bacterium]